VNTAKVWLEIDSGMGQWKGMNNSVLSTQLWVLYKLLQLCLNAEKKKTVGSQRALYLTRDHQRHQGQGREREKQICVTSRGLGNNDRQKTPTNNEDELKLLLATRVLLACSY